MSRKLKQRAQATEGLAAYILREGLRKTSVRDLAAAVDISDRMLLYYFDDKADIMTAVLEYLAARMTMDIDGAFKAGETLDTPALFKRLSRLTISPEFSPFMRLWIEISAAAVRGEEPYARVSRAIAAGFILWLQSRLDVPDGVDTQAEAAMLLGMIDGLTLLHLCTDDAVRDMAISAMAEVLEKANR